MCIVLVFECMLCMLLLRVGEWICVARIVFLLCSARIGRAEDDEELARERGQQRKRTKVKGKPPVLKKSKLSI